MKVIDTRTGTELPGRCLMVLPAGKELSSREVLKIYGVQPGHRAHNVMARACPYDRLFLLLGHTVDRHYRIIQKQPFHKLEEDDRPTPDDVDAELFAELGAAQ